MGKVKSIEWTGSSLLVLDQKKLPVRLEYVECKKPEDVAVVIKSMKVRGAPAIGATAAWGIVLGALQALEALKALESSEGLASEQKHGPVSEQKHSLASGQGHDFASKELDFDEYIHNVAKMIRDTRPTAVNLAWAVNRMLANLEASRGKGIRERVDSLLKEAKTISEEDIRANRLIGSYGGSLIKDGYGILTHCNTGSLATVDYGTALGVLRNAWEGGKRIKVFIDETRPYLQGARLTAWELVQEGIESVLIADNMAGWVMKQGWVNMVIVGADRITAAGDVANKIGTYSLAILAKAHGIPFYVAAPISTIDPEILSGDDIPIETRADEELTVFCDVRIAPEGVEVYNPAFDVTPSEYITGIITEKGILTPPYRESIRRALSNGL